MLCSFRCSSPQIFPECWLTVCLGGCTHGPRRPSPGPQPWSKESVPLCCCTHKALSRLPADLWNGCSSGLGRSLRKSLSSLSGDVCGTITQPLAISCCFCVSDWDLLGGQRAVIYTRVKHLHTCWSGSRLPPRFQHPGQQRKGKITYKRKLLISQCPITQNRLCFKPSRFL